MRTSLLTLLVALLLLLSPPARGQSVLYTFDGVAAGDNLGTAVASAGDVDGDGRPDLVVGTPFDDQGDPQAGSVQVFSGADGSLLHLLLGPAPDNRLGRSVAGGADVDGDGRPDLIAGWVGGATVFSGASGATLFTFSGEASENFGAAVALVDVNADGLADPIVGAPGADGTGTDSGALWVYSGADGSVLYTLQGDASGDWLGTSLAAAGDVDGDGWGDWIAGAPGNDAGGFEAGRAQVYSGADGSVLHTFDGTAVGGELGLAVAGAGDLNADGFADLIVGAPFDDTNGPASGSAQVFSGRDGALLLTFLGQASGDDLGFAVAAAGDVDGDGVGDLIVGAVGTDGAGSAAGSALVFSGSDGTPIYTFEGDAEGDQLGWAVAGAGDVDADGLADVIVGAPLADTGDTDSGRARVYGACSLGEVYCSPAVDNSSGLPAAISACGSTLVADNNLTLVASDMPADKFGYFLMSETQGFVVGPGGSQGNLCLSGKIGRFRLQIQNSGPTGTISIQVDLNDIPVDSPNSITPGETWNFQAWFRDNNPDPTSNFTDGLSILFH